MPRHRLDVESPPEWRPLERVIELTRGRLESPLLEPGTFMYMGRLVAAFLPTVHLYKHIVTRRYLSLDGGGHAYRLGDWRNMSRAGASVRCTAHWSLWDGLAWVLRLDVGTVDISGRATSSRIGSAGAPGP